jgi:hypothetical protein
MITLKYIVDQAREQLLDRSKRMFSDQQLIDFVNDGRILLYSMRPRVYEVKEVVALAQGFRQTVPFQSNKLFAALENVTAISQRAITPIDRELMNRSRPRWRGEAQSNEIVHFMVSELEPTAYEVYPPAIAGTQIRLSYAKPPAAYTLAQYGLGTPPTLVEERDCALALIDYATARALMKQSDASPESATKTNAHMTIFTSMLEAELVGRSGTSANNNTTSINQKPAK